MEKPIPVQCLNPSLGVLKLIGQLEGGGGELGG